MPAATHPWPSVGSRSHCSLVLGVGSDVEVELFRTCVPMIFMWEKPWSAALP